MSESPAFQKMKDEGTRSKAPLSEAFGQWKNAKIALIALLGLVAGQAVVWYTGQFYALFFLQSILKVDLFTANVLIAWSLILGTGGFIVFGSLSDRIGRKPIILAGCLIAALTYFPLFGYLTQTASPQLAKALDTVKVVAVVQLCPGRTPDEASLRHVAAETLARYKLPKAFVFVDEVVRSPSGKADYRWARDVVAGRA